MNEMKINTTPTLNTEENDRYEEELTQAYKEYTNRLENIQPGSKSTMDNFTKIISLIKSENKFLKNPTLQKQKIETIIEDLFQSPDECEKMCYLYPDFLQYNQMNDLKFQNSPEEVSKELKNYFSQKFFSLNNKREKIISRSNNILNFNHLDEKFLIQKDQKLAKINSEIEQTLKRVIRLINDEVCTKKDFEYYLKHFKLKKLDSVSLKQKQTETHFNLRKDDFEVYFRDICYTNRNLNHLKSFEPIVKYMPIKSGLEIWKNSKINLQQRFQKIYTNSMKKIKTILNDEKAKCDHADSKIFKEYFKSKYIFYYNLKQKYEKNSEGNNGNIIQDCNYDIIYPPLIISINSEIRFYLKELCDYFNILYDISIDKGKVLSYSIDSFFNPYFTTQIKNFDYIPYELSYNDIVNNIIDNQDDVVIETITSEVLRNKYSPKEGFVVNNGSKNFLSNNKTNFSNIYVKKANWVKFLCVKPSVNFDYSSFQKQIEGIGYVDSLIKFEIDLIDVVDINTITRIIEENTASISKSVGNTVKIISDGLEQEEYSQFRNLIKDVIEIKDDNLNAFDSSYASKVEGDFLKYFLMLRFLKLRDYKYYILNLLNYFRYIQKKFTIDLYKIENKNWKKSEDLTRLSSMLSENLYYSKKDTDIKTLIEKLPLSQYSQTNPILPSYEYNPEAKIEYNEFTQILVNELDELVDYSEKVIKIKDNRGNNIIYDATLSDMKQLELEMGKIGTYFIQKSEQLVTNTEVMPSPSIDRSQVILDLFTHEYEYHSAKFELVSELVTCYDNTTDILLQKSFIQMIIDIIANRPQIDLNYKYFVSNYVLETESLRKKAAFLHTLIAYQKKRELAENKQLFESLDKYHWMLGETALELIKHVRLDKLDVEIMKKYIKEKNLANLESKVSNDRLVDVESLINIYAKLQCDNEEFEIKEKFTHLKNIIPNENANKAHTFFNEENVSDSLNSKSFDEEIIKPNETGQKEETYFHENEEKENILKSNKDEEKYKINMLKNITNLISFMKKLFNKALADSDNNYMDNNIESLLKEDDNSLASIKEILNISLQESNDFKKVYSVTSRSYSIPDSSQDLLNYKIRSLLNIPNAFTEDNNLKYLEKNGTVIQAMLTDFSFTQYEEGYPDKFQQSSNINHIHEIEFFESIPHMLVIINQIEKSFSKLNSLFSSESKLAKKSLEISYMDKLIEEWENYKEYITGRKKVSEFDQIYFMQNTLLDNHQTLLHSIKSLVAILSTNISRIPPQLLAKLPLKMIEKIEFDKINFNTNNNINANYTTEKLENMLMSELHSSLMSTLMGDIKSDWLKFNDEFTEIKLYCNLIELYRTKEVFTKNINSTTYLKSIYESQKVEILNRNEDMFAFKEDNMRKYMENIRITQNTREEEIKEGENYADYGIKKYESILITANNVSTIPKFSINEFDPTLLHCLNLHDLLQCQINILEGGLSEVKTVAQYEYMNLSLLIVAVQHNHSLLFEPLKYSAEIDLFDQHRLRVLNGLFDYEQVIQSQYNKPDKSTPNINHILFECRSRVKGVINRIGKEFFYSIVDKKRKNRSNIADRYINFYDTQVKFMQKQDTIKRVLCRQYRLLVTNAYAFDIITDTYLDAIKLQTCQAAKHLKNMVKIIPKEFNTFEVNNLNFFEIDSRITSLYLNKNFAYFNDRTQPWTNFYIPSSVEILRLESQTDVEVVFHYSQFNPFLFTEDVNDKKFFTQLKQNFFKSPTKCNKLENFRNKFFEESNSYQSNSFLLLQMITFFINVLNLKFFEIGLKQNPNDLLKLYEKNRCEIDFWGDKVNGNIIARNTKSSDKLHLSVIENIIQNQTNYLNLRKNFEKLKIDLDDMIVDMRSYLVVEQPNKNIKTFMESYLRHSIKYWLSIFYTAREYSIKSCDMVSLQFFNHIISRFKSHDYFKDHNCPFECHINSSLPNNKEYVIENLFKSHFSLNSDKDCGDAISYYHHLGRSSDNLFDYTNFSSELLNFVDISIYEMVKVDYLFLKFERTIEIKDLCFNFARYIDKFMICNQISRPNSHLIEILIKKSEFLEFFQKLSEFKYKLLIIIKDDFISTDSKAYVAVEELYPKFCLSTETIEDLLQIEIEKKNPSQSSYKNISRKNSGVQKKELKANSIMEHDSEKTNSFIPKSRTGSLFNIIPFNDKQYEDFIKVFDNKIEYSTKSENSKLIEKFINSTSLLFQNIKKEIRLFYLKKGIDSLRQENLAIVELTTSARNDLDISKFTNNFSSNFVKELDETRYFTLNRKFSFFENFINKIKNISLEVETHGISNAILITKHEWEDSLKNLMREFIIYDTNLHISEQMAYNSEKFGYCLTIKKKEILGEILQEKLKEFNQNLEKISNAKLALTGNKMVYEMDHLYRQLKILKDNIYVMEEYIKNYYEDKFKSIISTLRTEVAQIESKFGDYRNNLVSSTVQKITDEYDNCLQVLKDKMSFFNESITKMKDDNVISSIHNAGNDRKRTALMTIKEEESKKLLRSSSTTTNIDVGKLNTKALDFNATSMALPIKKVSYKTPMKRSSNFLPTIAHTNSNFYSSQLINQDNEDTQYDHFMREIELESNHNKQINKERLKIDGLNEDISRLHGLYRMKLNLRKVKYDDELQELKQSLSSNKDLWDKLSISERNERILKEELAKTEKSLASAEEFIKKLQIQIRKLHDKNVNIEKQLSAMTTHQILKNNSNIEIKEMELYKHSKRSYVYNMKNNINLLSAIDSVKARYTEDKSIATILENLEMLHIKYAEEIDGKKVMVNNLNEIKKDVERMKHLENKKIEEFNKQIAELVEENKRLKGNRIEVDKLNQNSLNKIISFDDKKISGNKSSSGFSFIGVSQDRGRLSKVGNNIVYGNDK